MICRALADGGVNILALQSNINYAYCGLEPGTHAPMVFFGVSDVERAASILEQAAASAVKP